MKKIRSVIYVGLLCIVLAGNYGTNVSAGTFTVTGTFISKEALDVADGSSSDASASLLPLGTAKVVVLSRHNNTKTDSSSPVLISGNSINGAITLIGEIEDSTNVTISVDVGLEEPLTLDAVVAPGREISFALLESPMVLAFFGSVNTATDLKQQFKISGNLNLVSSDAKLGAVSVLATERDARGETVSFFWRTLLQHNHFEIIGEVSEPRVVVILVQKGANFAETQAVIEPGAEIEVVTRTDSLADLYAISPSGTGKQALLVDSWQQTDEYWSTKLAYTKALEQYQLALLSPKTRTNTTIKKPRATEAPSIDQNAPKQESVQEITDECAKYASRSYRVNHQVPLPPTVEVPDHVALSRKINRLRNSSLETLAEYSVDPIDSLLALELGAYWGSPERQAIYDSLVLTLDRDIVERRVNHDRNDHGQYLNQQEQSFSLRPGSKAPEFALLSFEGAKIELYDIVANQKHVLVEFWASWCGPCIRALPGLKSVYTEYRSEGFEIVSISLDNTHSLWAEATEEHDLPWINLAELKESSNEVASMYGVRSIPNNYLLDHNGCIVQKDVSSVQLMQILSEAYSNTKARNTL